VIIAAAVAKLGAANVGRTTGIAGSPHDVADEKINACVAGSPDSPWSQMPSR
jgi:hypothetical protein